MKPNTKWDKPTFFIAAIIFLTSGCYSAPSVPSPQPGFTASPPTQVTLVSTTIAVITDTAQPPSTPLPTSLSTSTNTSPPSKTPSPILPSPTPNLNVLRVPVETTLETVFWSGDGNRIYYALSSYNVTYEYEGALQWQAFEIQSGVSITLTAAPQIDRPIVLPYNGFYPEFRGLTSPSGRYAFREVSNESSDTTEIWLDDLVTQHELKLVETFPGYVSTAEWFSDETRVIFEVANQHYGGTYYLTDIQTGITELLCQPDDSRCWIIEERLALSPDDSMLAGLNWQFEIRIDTMDSRVPTYISEMASQLTWSYDGRLLYYWLHLPTGYSPITQLRMYDVMRGVSSTVIDKSDLTELGICPSEYVCYFDVSPNGKQFVFWDIFGPDQSFWIVTLP